jgi:hypothetical protein
MLKRSVAILAFAAVILAAEATTITCGLGAHFSGSDPCPGGRSPCGEGCCPPDTHSPTYTTCCAHPSTNSSFCCQNSESCCPGQQCCPSGTTCCGTSSSTTDCCTSGQQCHNGACSTKPVPTPPIPQMFSCDSVSHKCSSDPTGSYSSKKACETACKPHPQPSPKPTPPGPSPPPQKYACNSQTLKCETDAKGQFPSKASCEKECPPPTPPPPPPAPTPPGCKDNSDCSSCTHASGCGWCACADKIGTAVVGAACINSEDTCPQLWKDGDPVKPTSDCAPPTPVPTPANTAICPASYPLDRDACTPIRDQKYGVIFCPIAKSRSISEAAPCVATEYLVASLPQFTQDIPRNPWQVCSWTSKIACPNADETCCDTDGTTAQCFKSTDADSCNCCRHMNSPGAPFAGYACGGLQRICVSPDDDPGPDKGHYCNKFCQTYEFDPIPFVKARKTSDDSVLFRECKQACAVTGMCQECTNSNYDLRNQCATCTAGLCGYECATKCSEKCGSACSIDDCSCPAERSEAAMECLKDMARAVDADSECVKGLFETAATCTACPESLGFLCGACVVNVLGSTLTCTKAVYENYEAYTTYLHKCLNLKPPVSSPPGSQAHSMYVRGGAAAG